MPPPPGAPSALHRRHGLWPRGTFLLPEETPGCTGHPTSSLPAVAATPGLGTAACQLRPYQPPGNPCQGLSHLRCPCPNVLPAATACSSFKTLFRWNELWVPPHTSHCPRFLKAKRGPRMLMLGSRHNLDLWPRHCRPRLGLPLTLMPGAGHGLHGQGCRCRFWNGLQGNRAPLRALPGPPCGGHPSACLGTLAMLSRQSPAPRMTQHLGGPVHRGAAGTTGGGAFPRQAEPGESFFAGTPAWDPGAPPASVIGVLGNES